MKTADALKAIQDYREIQDPTEDDEFMYTEALGMLIDKTKDPKYMAELAWFYCERKRFDIELKYLEMAAECGYGPAYEELGFMWFHGQHGEKDYAKAFEYFTMGMKDDRYGNPGSLWCRYKLADMYRYGCSVEKDDGRYRRMIEEAYEEVKNPGYLNDPFPEISLRLAGIRAEQGRKEEAAELLRRAKQFMAERLSVDPFWGHLEDMKRIVFLLYELTPFDKEGADFYDLFYLTENPGRFTMKRHGKKLELEVTEENGERAIGYDGKWYRSFEDLCLKAVTGNKKLTGIYDEFYDIREAV